MTQEEKLKEAKRLYKTANADQKYVLERLFPELAESRDEVIRKELISFFTERAKHTEDSTFNGLSSKEIIAWLEKQCENISQHNFTFDDVLALQCAMTAAKNMQKDKDLYEQLESLHDRVHDAYWLKKQCEQKPIDLVAILKDYFANTPKEQREKDWAELKHLNDVGFDAEIAFGAKDSELQEETYFIPKGFHAEIDGDKVVIKKGEQKPWSEEDEKYFNAIISVIKKNQSSISLEDWDINWLESIKDRVQTQPQQEWSEEDIVVINCAVEALSKDIPSLAASLRRLKSLSPQYAWKPTEDQMDALAWALSLAKNCGEECAFDLRTLYEQLKKLRKE